MLFEIVEVGFSVFSITENPGTDSFPIACLKRKRSSYSREMNAVDAIMELVLIALTVKGKTEGKTELQFLEMSFVDNDSFPRFLKKHTLG